MNKYSVMYLYYYLLLMFIIIIYKYIILYHYIIIIATETLLLLWIKLMDVPPFLHHKPSHNGTNMAIDKLSSAFAYFPLDEAQESNASVWHLPHIV